MVSRPKIKSIISKPNQWHGCKVELTGWCLRTIEGNDLIDTLDETIFWIPVLGLRRGPGEGIYLDLGPDMLRLFEAAAIHFDGIWNPDMRYRYPYATLAKVRVRGDVVYHPPELDGICLDGGPRILVIPDYFEPLFSGIVEWGRHMQMREGG